VLEAQETVRLARQGVTELQKEPGRAQAPGVRAGQTEANLRRHRIQRESAEIALMEAEEELRTDRRNLGVLLAIPALEAEQLEVRGLLREPAAAPVGGAALARLALVSRPDLVAYRLGLGRADADVRLALANRYQDIFLVYQPYTFQDDRPLQAKSAHSWGVGVSVPLPVFNRNQGNIQRARLNVAQSQAELGAVEDQVVAEVRQSERALATTRAAVDRMERSLLPSAKEAHDVANKQYLAGEVDEQAFLLAEQDYDRVIRQYRDMLVRHRRSMLKLNTAVGQRILP
jgi:outer membrane protein, heavy metal efflux system